MKLWKNLYGNGKWKRNFFYKFGNFMWVLYKSMQVCNKCYKIISRKIIKKFKKKKDVTCM